MDGAQTPSSARPKLPLPALDDRLSAAHLARLVAELVNEHLELVRIRAADTEARAGPPYDPRPMVRARPRILED